MVVRGFYGSGFGVFGVSIRGFGVAGLSFQFLGFAVLCFVFGFAVF